jgi:signal transduction histidine kinase
MTISSADFSLILAASIHDMKNSLGVLLSSLEELRDEQQASGLSSATLDILQFQAERIHNDLVRLLGSYRLQQNMLSAHTEEHFVPDLLDSAIARYSSVLESQGIGCQNRTQDISGYFDRQLIASVLDNSVSNAVRYAKHEICLNAAYYEGYLVISVQDDGPGFKDSMLRQETDHSIDFSEGNTHLGLYFANAIAALHSAGERQGFIKLLNGGEFGGAVFEIWLP